MPHPLQRKIIQLRDQPNTKKILALGQAALQSITDYAGNPLPDNTLLELIAEPWQETESQNLFWVLFHYFFPEDNATVPQYTFTDHPQFPEELRQEHNRVLQRHIATVKTGNILGLFYFEASRVAAVNTAVETPDEIIASRYFLLLALWTRMVTFACSMQQKANPVSVICAVEQMVNRVVQAELLQENSWGGVMEGRTKKHIDEFCLFLTASDQYPAMLAKLKTTLQTIYLLQLPAQLLATDVAALRDGRFCLRRILVLYLYHYDRLQSPISARLKRLSLTITQLHADYIEETLATFTEAIVPGGKPLAIVRQMRKRHPQLAESVQRIYQHLAQLERQFSMTQDTQAFIAQANGCVLVENGMRFDRYADGLMALWDKIETCLHLPAASPLLQGALLPLTIRVKGEWQKPRIHRASIHALQQGAVSLEDIEKHDYLSQPSVLADIRNRLRDQSQRMMRLAKQYGGIYNERILQGFLDFIIQPLNRSLPAHMTNTQAYTVEQLTAVIRAHLRDNPTDSDFWVLLGEARDCTVIRDYWESCAEYLPERMVHDQLAVHATAWRAFFEALRTVDDTTDIAHYQLILETCFQNAYHAQCEQRLAEHLGVANQQAYCALLGAYLTHYRDYYKHAFGKHTSLVD